jgi:hypothetical protein
VDGSVLQLTPMATSAATATFVPNSATALWGWRCGPATGTAPEFRKYLPGSCRE